MAYQGYGILDPRLIFLKDKIIGFAGSAQGFYEMPVLESTRQIPITAGAANIAAAQNVTNGTAMTLVTTNALGISCKVPVRQFSQVLGAGSIVTAAVALDFGFGFGTAVSGNATLTVGSILGYKVGMPVVLCATSGTSAPFLSVIVSMNPATPSITLAAAPGFSATVAIGTGDLWGPNEVPAGYPTPLGAYPFLAKGPGLFLDARQAVTRTIRVTGVSGGAGGTFLCNCMDIYGQPLTISLVATAAATTVYALKAVKYILSIVPQFTDAHNYSIGTSDVFGFNFRSSLWEDMTISWAGNLMTANTGWIAADDTNPATSSTGDVRGTVQVNTAAGPSGGGIGTTASNGSLSGLLLTGNRLEIVQRIGVHSGTFATQANPEFLMGVTQV